MAILKKIKNVGGFSLIELMVVVAIIGILAAVAVPQYTKYQGRARQTEAKISLGAIYSAEKSFYVEQGKYSACLVNIGYQPEGRRFYAVGYDTLNTGNNCWQFDSASSACISPCGTTAQNVSVYYATAAAGAAAPSSVSGGSCGTASFTAGAHGQIGAATEDVWVMDETHKLWNTTQSY